MPITRGFRRKHIETDEEGFEPVNEKMSVLLNIIIAIVVIISVYTLINSK